MTVIAHTTAGQVIPLAVEFSTPEDVLARVEAQTSSALTGSAMPDVWLDTKDGGKIRYSTISKLSQS